MLNEPTITIHGNLVRDPELRYTAKGMACANFSVAQSPRIRNAQGEYSNGEAVFFNCTAWQTMAENVAKSLKRGDPVTIVGRMRRRPWETKEGEARFTDEVQCDDVAVSLANRSVRVIKTAREHPGETETQQDTATAVS